MKTRYTISIPKPCHEKWLEMTPNDKGRFCQSCSKTVVDFTNMKTNAIQEFVHQNKDQRICGHIRQNQLDAVNLQISDRVFEQTLSFHKLFLLSLLLAMGTSLFSCADDKGNIKKIKRVEIIEKTIDTAHIEVKKQVDSILTTCSSKDKTDGVVSKKDNIIKTTTSVVLDGMIIVTGDIDKHEKLPIDPDSIVDPQYPEIEGEIAIQDEIIIGLLTVENPPEFKDTPKNLSIKEKREYFKEKISQFVLEKFNSTACINLFGRQKINVQFAIDENGSTKAIKTRGPNSSLEKEAMRVIRLLPRFIPATHKGKPIDMIYNLPIIFKVED